MKSNWIVALNGIAVLSLAHTSAEDAKPPVRVIQSRNVDLGARSLILNRIEPPAPELEPAATTVQTQEEEAFKPYEMLAISATVYDRQVTEIRWSHNGREFRAFTNIDFNYVAGLGAFETLSTWYSVVLGLGNQTRADVEAQNTHALAQGFPTSALKQIPALSEFSPSRSEYKMVADEANAIPADATKGIEALHRYFDTHKVTLVARYEQLLVEQAERERELRENPPVPKDTVINFWPKKSRNYNTGK